MMEVRREAIEQDCQEAKLIAEDAMRRRKADEAVRKTNRMRAKAFENREDAAEAERAERTRIRGVVAAAANRGGQTNQAVPVVTSAPPTTVGIDPQAHRPARIRYGVRKPSTGAAQVEPNLAGFLGGDVMEQRCRQTVQLVADMKKTESELEKTMERFRLQGQTAQLGEAAKRLEALRSVRAKLEAGSSGCHHQ